MNGTIIQGDGKSQGEVDVETAARILKRAPCTIRRMFRRGKIEGHYISSEKGGGMGGKKLLIRISGDQESRESGDQGIGKSGDLVESSLRQEIREPDKEEIEKGKGGMEVVESLSRRVIGSETEGRELPIIGPKIEVISEKNMRVGNLRADLLRQLELNLAENGRDRTEKIQRFLNAYNSGLLLPAIFSKIGEISRATLYEWMGAMNHGGIQALAPRYGAAESCRITEDEKNILLSLVLNQNKIKVGSAIRMMKYLLEKRKIDSPSSDSTLRRWVEGFKKNHFDKWILFREGEKALNDQVTPYIERDRELLEVGEGLVADGHRLNFNAINPFTGKPCRPAMILFWDWRSSYPVGWEIMLQENVQCISSALRMAIITLGKMPKWVLIDNGKAFKAKVFNSKIDLEEAGLFGMYARLGIRTHFAMPYNAQSKPVERFFRTFTDWFERMIPSFVGSSIEDKPAYMKRNEKLMRRIHNDWVPTIPEAMEMMAKWREFYIDQPSRGLKGKTPREVFGSLSRGVVGSEIDLADLHYLMMAMEIRTIHRNGVTFLGRHWYDDSLYGLRDRVTIRYSFSDLSQIYVFTSKGEFLGAARPVTPVHPMICEDGDPHDMEILKREMTRKRSLRRETIKVARMIGDKIDAVLPMREIVAQIPDVVGAIEKAQTEMHPPALNPSPFLEGEEMQVPSPRPSPARGEGGIKESSSARGEGGIKESSSARGEGEIGEETGSRSPLSGPWQPDSPSRLEWYERQHPAMLTEADRSWIEDYKVTLEYNAIYGSQDGQSRLAHIRSLRPENCGGRGGNT